MNSNLTAPVQSEDLPPATAKRRTFSDFIRNATPEEKEAVYLEVIDRVNARQREVIASASPPFLKG